MRTTIYLGLPNMQDNLLKKPTLFAPKPLKHLFYYIFLQINGSEDFDYSLIYVKKIKLRVQINKMYFPIVMKQKVTGKPTAKKL